MNPKLVTILEEETILDEAFDLGIIGSIMRALSEWHPQKRMDKNAKVAVFKKASSEKEIILYGVDEVLKKNGFKRIESDQLGGISYSDGSTFVDIIKKGSDIEVAVNEK